MRSLIHTLGFIVRHRLNRDAPFRALARSFRWQLTSRLLDGAVAVPFVDGTRLLVERGMAGATGNIYYGLHEFEGMGFVLHAPARGDVFVDVGANVGAYTVLAAGSCGARVVAVEPLPATFAHLMDNIRLNDLGELVSAHNIALGAVPGKVTFTSSLDTVNHIVAPGEAAEGAVEIQATSLDALLGEAPASVLKIDVEGFEAEVIRGAHRTLQRAQAVLIELNGSGARYGFADIAVHDELLAHGFTACRYDPLSRSLGPSVGLQTDSPNSLYVRHVHETAEKLARAPRHRVLGRAL